MSREEFRTVVKATITNENKILIGQKEDGDKPHSNKWHFLGGHLEKGEQPEEAIKREVKEETGLDVKVKKVVDVMTFPWVDGKPDSLQVLYHCVTDDRDAEPRDDLKSVKWVSPEEVNSELWDVEAKRNRERRSRKEFLEKLD